LLNGVQIMQVASASLDPLETPVAEPPLEASSAIDARSTSLPQPFKHSGWRPQRERIYRAILAGEASGWRSKRFATCGANAWVLGSKTEFQRYKVVLTCCHDRFCVPCARARAANIRANLAKHTEGRTLRFVTLTLAHTAAPLVDQLDRLYRAFRTLRGKPVWKDRVRGGVAFLELKLGNGETPWHPHLHVLIDSTFLPQHQLSSTWLDVTGDSKIVDIRLVRDVAEIDKYVTKYVTKPISANAYRDSLRLNQAIAALSGRRMFITFGDCRNWRLTEPADPSAWTLIASETELRERALDGDTFAEQLLDRIAAFIYGHDDAEFVIDRTISCRPPPAATPDAQLRLW
jgi:hypothetical protein